MEDKCATKIEPGQIECMFCTQHISAKSFKRTCHTCREELEQLADEQQARVDAGLELEKGWTANENGKVIWYEQKFYTELVSLHKDFMKAEREAVEVCRELRRNPDQEPMSGDLVRVNTSYHEVYRIVRDLYATERLGAKRIRSRLVKMGYAVSYTSVCKYLKIAKNVVAEHEESQPLATAGLR